MVSDTQCPKVRVYCDVVRVGGFGGSVSFGGVGSNIGSGSQRPQYATISPPGIAALTYDADGPWKRRGDVSGDEG